MVDISEYFYIIGHRGAAGERLENTLDGFEYARGLGVDAIELDVREHSSRLWVIHDSNLARLTGSAKYDPDLARLTGNEDPFEDHADPSTIRLLDGSAVPTLEQVFDLTWGKIPLNVEIKSVKNLDLLLDLFARYNHPPEKSPNGLPWILVSSFDHRSLMQLRQRACPWPLAPIISHKPWQIDLQTDQIGPWSWHFDDEYLDFYQISQLRECGIPSLVFTVNDPARMDELRKRGVAGVFTDFPSLLLRHRDG